MTVIHQEGCWEKKGFTHLELPPVLFIFVSSFLKTLQHIKPDVTISLEVKGHYNYIDCLVGEFA